MSTLALLPHRPMLVHSPCWGGGGCEWHGWAWLQPPCPQLDSDREHAQVQLISRSSHLSAYDMLYNLCRRVQLGPPDASMAGDLAPARTGQYTPLGRLPRNTHWTPVGAGDQGCMTRMNRLICLHFWRGPRHWMHCMRGPDTAGSAPEGTMPRGILNPASAGLESVVARMGRVAMQRARPALSMPEIHS